MQPAFPRNADVQTFTRNKGGSGCFGPDFLSQISSGTWDDVKSAPPGIKGVVPSSLQNQSCYAGDVSLCMAQERRMLPPKQEPLSSDLPACLERDTGLDSAKRFENKIPGRNNYTKEYMFLASERNVELADGIINLKREPIKETRSNLLAGRNKVPHDYEFLLPDSTASLEENFKTASHMRTSDHKSMTKVKKGFLAGQSKVPQEYDHLYSDSVPSPDKNAHHRWKSDHDSVIGIRRESFALGKKTSHKYNLLMSESSPHFDEKVTRAHQKRKLCQDTSKEIKKKVCKGEGKSCSDDFLHSDWTPVVEEDVEPAIEKRKDDRDSTKETRTLGHRGKNNVCQDYDSVPSVSNPSFGEHVNVTHYKRKSNHDSAIISKKGAFAARNSVTYEVGSLASQIPNSEENVEAFQRKRKPSKGVKHSLATKTLKKLMVDKEQEREKKQPVELRIMQHSRNSNDAVSTKVYSKEEEAEERVKKKKAKQKERTARRDNRDPDVLSISRKSRLEELVERRLQGKTAGDINFVAVEQKNLVVQKKKLIKKGGANFLRESDVPNQECESSSSDVDLIGAEEFFVKQRVKEGDDGKVERKNPNLRAFTEGVVSEQFVHGDGIKSPGASPSDSTERGDPGSHPFLKMAQLEKRPQVFEHKMEKSSPVLTKSHEGGLNSVQKQASNEDKQPIGVNELPANWYTSISKAAVVKRHLPPGTTKKETTEKALNLAKPVQGMKEKLKRLLKKTYAEGLMKSKGIEKLDMFDPDLASVVRAKNSASGRLCEAVSAGVGHGIVKTEADLETHNCSIASKPLDQLEGHAKKKKVSFDKVQKLQAPTFENGKVTHISSKESDLSTKKIKENQQKKLQKIKFVCKGSVGLDSIDLKEVEVASELVPILPTSVGCARCSIDGWKWRSWAREGAKRRLQTKVKVTGSSTKDVKKGLTKKLKPIRERESIFIVPNISAPPAGLQTARKNRATMRKLAVAAEGSDMLKVNFLKV